MDDTETSTEIPAPTEPGFYQYSGGGQKMMFLLDEDGQWWVWVDSAGVDKCEWGYIEQCLGVWDLVKISSLEESRASVVRE